MTFERYEWFIYINSNMKRSEAREYARECWNKGVDKYEALKEARKKEAGETK